jgi:hypothetical protein
MAMPKGQGIGGFVHLPQHLHKWMGKIELSEQNERELDLMQIRDFEENFKPCWRKPVQKRNHLLFIFISHVTSASLNTVELARLSGLCRCQMLSSDFQWLN